MSNELSENRHPGSFEAEFRDYRRTKSEYQAWVGAAGSRDHPHRAGMD